MMLRTRFLAKSFIRSISTIPHRHTGTKRSELYKQNGFVVLKNLIKPEDIESMRNAGSLIIRSVGDHPEGPVIGAAYGYLREIKDEYLFLTGGLKVTAHIKEVKLTENVKGFMGAGLSIINGGLHDLLRPFYKFAYGELVKRICKNLLHFEAPLIGNSMYVSYLRKDWNILRKDNSLVRTYPLSTHVFSMFFIQIKRLL